jgi:hypothetical protein
VIAPDTSIDPFRVFVTALPANARTALHRTETVVAMVHAAIREHGWTAQQLAAECGRDLTDVANAGGLVTHRLRHAAGNPPAQRASFGAKRPFCTDECRQNAGWLLDPDTLLPLRPCPCRKGTGD